MGVLWLVVPGSVAFSNLRSRQPLRMHLAVESIPFVEHEYDRSGSTVKVQRHASTRIWIVVLGVFLSACVVYPAAQDPIAHEIARLEQTFGDALRNARYMEQNCEPATHTGWEGFPLSKCRYTVVDKNGLKKEAAVIMLNPSIEQLARWIVNSCVEVTGSAAPSCTNQVMKWILAQSGAQFPVAGIVFEDILPHDGTHEIFAFRDGVTVKVDGVEHRGTRPPSSDEIARSLTGAVTWVGRYARLQSTTPQQYRDNGGQEDVGDDTKRTLGWLDVNRKLYQAAWGHDRNEMMIAWTRKQFF
jgi:hypothetical protein